jgi:RNA polymerase sigma-70 factor, ECF subfamily
MQSTSDLSLSTAEQIVVEAYRTDWGRLVSLLVVRTRRLDLVEDALAEAFSRAAVRWPVDGVPENPAGWLFVAAHRVVLGWIRSEAAAGRVMPLLAVRSQAVSTGETVETGDDSLPDERLQLILLCCHPALDPTARSALALRLVIGTSTDEIARLFLVQKSTMAARLTRAKRKIVAAGIPLVLPVEQELAMRIDAVCRTIYLAFTAGYTPSHGPDLLRAEPAGEAVWLATMLYRLLPQAVQVRALLALVMLQHARRDSRVCDGKLVTLAEQDRSRWHRSEIEAAVLLLRTVPTSTGYAEELRLQALAAREHATAKAAADTNWIAIANHYAELEALTGSPIVSLNRAVAIAEISGPHEGLALLSSVADVLDGHHRFHAVLADLAQRSDKAGVSRSAYARAIDLCTNDIERSFLMQQLSALNRTDR